MLRLFSDGLNWCKEKFGDANNNIYVDWNTEQIVLDICSLCLYVNTILLQIAHLVGGERG